jgi:LysM repeat protein
MFLMERRERSLDGGFSSGSSGRPSAQQKKEPKEGRRSFALASLARAMTGAMVQGDRATKSFAVYTVRTGDTLDILSRRFGVEVKSILGANPHITSPDLIREGQHVKMPLKQVQIKANRIMKPVKVQKGNTLHGIAAMYGTSAQNLMVCNGLKEDTIFPGDDLLIPLTLCEHIGNKARRSCELNGAKGNGLSSLSQVTHNNFHFNEVGKPPGSSMRDLCRNYLFRRTYRRRLPNPTFLGVASFLGGPDVSDLTIRYEMHEI